MLEVHFKYILTSLMFSTLNNILFKKQQQHTLFIDSVGCNALISNYLL